jgi:hypothetical protein
VPSGFENHAMVLGQNWRQILAQAIIVVKTQSFGKFIRQSRMKNAIR